MMTGWPEDKMDWCYVCDRSLPEKKMRDGFMGKTCTSGDCIWEDNYRHSMIKLLDETDELLVYPR